MCFYENGQESGASEEKKNKKDDDQKTVQPLSELHRNLL